MPDPVTGAVVGGASLLSGGAQALAGAAAAGAQKEAALAGIAEQRRQYEATQKLLEPYSQVGVPALQRQQALAGLAGPEAQQAAIAELEQSPLFQAIQRQGENALLQQAAATGGLRGGNIQAVLAQFRPQLLNQQLEQQYNRLAGLTTLGQQSAAGIGSAGSQFGQQASGLYGNIGQAEAGKYLAYGQAASNALQTPALLAGMYAIGKKF